MAKAKGAGKPRSATRPAAAKGGGRKTSQAASKGGRKKVA